MDSPENMDDKLIQEDALCWTREKLFKKNGNHEFLEEKVNKYKTLRWFFDAGGNLSEYFIPESLRSKFEEADSIERFLSLEITPLEATIIAGQVVTGEFIDPLLNGHIYHDLDIATAISSVRVDCELTEDIDYSFGKLQTPDTRIFPHNMTILDMINIIDKNVCRELYFESEADETIR